jgi:hypothetical protein
MTFDDLGVITAYQSNSVQLSDAIAGDPVVYQSVVDDYADVQLSMGKVVGRLSINVGYEHTCLFGECAIGDWATESFCKFGKTQIAMLGYGGFASGASRSASSSPTSRSLARTSCGPSP